MQSGLQIKEIHKHLKVYISETGRQDKAQMRISAMGIDCELLQHPQRNCSSMTLYPTNIRGVLKGVDWNGECSMDYLPLYVYRF